MEIILNVTQDIINMARSNDPRNCMIALALRAKGAWSISVTRELIRFNKNMMRYYYDTPAPASRQVEIFDTKGRDFVKPHKIRLQGGACAAVIIRPKSPKPYKPRTKPNKKHDSRWCIARRDTRGGRIRKDLVK